MYTPHYAEGGFTFAFYCRFKAFGKTLKALEILHANYVSHDYNDDTFHGTNLKICAPKFY